MSDGSRRLKVGLAVGFLAGALAVYLAMLIALVVFQRRMMYFPAGVQGPAVAFGLPKAQTLSLKTSDDQTIVAWYQVAAPGKPLFIYFHGNGGTLAIRGEWLRRLSADGSGFLAVDYRGYGGSTGAPSETGLIHDGEAAYAEARALGYGPDRIVIIGESIGTGVAVAVAAERRVKALVLDSAFSSAAEIAAARYWMFPVKLLMKDPFGSIDRIGQVEAPKLFLHASGDPVIPLASGRRLFDRAKEPKAFVEVHDIGHTVLGRLEVMARMKVWVAALPTNESPSNPP